MARHANAATHLRRFANAIAIALVTPKTSPVGGKSMRSLLAAVNRGYEASRSDTYLRNFLATAPAQIPHHEALGHIVAGAAAPPSLSNAARNEFAPPVPVQAPVGAAESADNDKTNRVFANSFFAQAPWQRDVAPHISQTKEPLNSALSARASEGKSLSAVDFFGTIAWGGGSPQSLSIAASSAVNPAHAANFGVLPGSSATSPASAASSFFAQIPWGGQLSSPTQQV